SQSAMHKSNLQNRLQAWATQERTITAPGTTLRNESHEATVNEPQSVHDTNPSVLTSITSSAKRNSAALSIGALAMLVVILAAGGTWDLLARGGSADQPSPVAVAKSDEKPVDSQLVAKAHPTADDHSTKAASATKTDNQPAGTKAIS